MENEDALGFDIVPQCFVCGNGIDSPKKCHSVVWHSGIRGASIHFAVINLKEQSDGSAQGRYEHTPDLQVLSCDQRT